VGGESGAAAHQRSRSLRHRVPARNQLTGAPTVSPFRHPVAIARGRIGPAGMTPTTKSSDQGSERAWPKARRRAASPRFS
jgi:hypothetical protein